MMKYIRKTALIEEPYYRYLLYRQWRGGSAVLFIGLNPSTADQFEDDPTIRRCVGFADRLGFGALYMGNLFAARTTDPRFLSELDDPVGPLTDLYLRKMADCTPMVVAVWGGHRMAWRRVSDIQTMFPVLYCFGQLGSGAPKHPLYLPKDAALRRMDMIHA